MSSMLILDLETLVRCHDAAKAGHFTVDPAVRVHCDCIWSDHSADSKTSVHTGESCLVASASCR